MSEALTLRGVLKGHSDWVTALATTSEDPGMIISASRDKTCLVWTLTNAGGDGEAYGYPRRALKGHSHFVSDVVISSECRDLLGKIFMADPNLRITIQGIKQHPWFLTALPQELAADDYLLYSLYSNHEYTDI